MNNLTRTMLRLLYYGPMKRLFRYVVRRLSKMGRIWSGPLIGRHLKGNQAQLLGIYEPAIEQIIHQHLCPGDVFYDVGANVGYLSLLAAERVGDNGYVYCFEPLPANVAKLRYNIEANNVKNCAIVEKAVSDSVGSAPFSVGDGTNSSLNASMNNSIIEVELITLDQVAQNSRSPKLVKIDVEGAEGRVLLGAQSLLNEPDAPILVIEIHDEINEQNVTSILEEANYEIRPHGRPKKNKLFPYHVLATKKQ